MDTLTDEMKKTLKDLEKEVFELAPTLKENQPKDCWTSDKLEACYWRRSFEYVYRPFLCERPEYQNLFKNENLWLRPRPIDCILRDFEQQINAAEMKKAFNFMGQVVIEMAKQQSSPYRMTYEEQMDSAMELANKRINGVAAYATDSEAYRAACNPHEDQVQKIARESQKDPLPKIIEQTKLDAQVSIANGKGKFKNITPEAKEEIDKLLGILSASQKISEINKQLQDLGINATVSVIPKTEENTNVKNIALSFLKTHSRR